MLYDPRYRPEAIHFTSDLPSLPQPTTYAVVDLWSALFRAYRSCDLADIDILELEVLPELSDAAAITTRDLQKN